MTRILCLLMLGVSSLSLDLRAQKPSVGGPLRSAAVEPRVEMVLRDGWRFKLGSDSATELQAEPDATWASVSVPHTWNRVGYYKDAASHINPPRTW